jgi:hypothetical protein
MNATHILPYGKHRGQAPAEVATDYLRWFLKTCKLSAGLRAAVAAELENRNVRVRLEPPPRLLRVCPEHGAAGGARIQWTVDRLGRKHLQVRCKTCNRFLDVAPQVPEYVEQASAERGGA